MSSIAKVILSTSASLVIAIACAQTVVHAQNTLAPPRFSVAQAGVYGAYQMVMHDASLVGIPGVPTCCVNLTSGSGPGYTFGLLYQIPLASQLALQLRAGYSHLGGTLTTTENIGNAVDGTGSVVNAMVEHRLQADLGLVSLEPMASWYPFSIPLAVNVGLQAAVFVSKGYNQSEVLTSPTNATFVGGQAIRNASEGDLLDSISTDRLFAAGVIGLAYDIPISRTLTLSPEIAYHYNFTNVIADSTWHAHALRLGFSVTMGFLSETSPAIFEDNSVLSASVQATGLFADSSEQPIVQIRVEEFLGMQLRPLLNYIFFDVNTSRLPNRYNRLTKDSARAFSVEHLHYLNALNTYHQILNIIGRRMQENPTARITLVGCNDDAFQEKGNNALSQARAESVRDYLRDTWDIADSRMKIESRGLPEKPSNINEGDGVGENRRVEIYADNTKIMEPVLTNDTLRTATPPAIRFRTSTRAQAGVRSWKLTAGQAGKVLKEFRGTGPVPDILDWNMEEDQTRVPRIPMTIDYQLEVTDVTGRHYAVPLASIATDQVTIQRKRSERIADMEVNRYSLILFDYGKSDINEANRRIIDYIKNRITLDATVTVTGYTDRVGDADFNRTLSKERARVTTLALGKGLPIGAGETMLYTNDLPEGRFYCRTVNVVVETPIVR